MEELNYNETLKSIRKLLMSWHYQDLTPYGKITVIKSLALSKLTHITTILPSLTNNMINELNQTFYSFLWDGKPDKINRKAVTIPEKFGGLGMINLHSFWASIQCGWIRRINTSNSFWVHILNINLAKTPSNLATIWTWGENKFLHAANIITNPFWKETLKSTAKLINSFTFASPAMIQLVPICNNQLFKINNRTVGETYFNGKQMQIADFMADHTTEFLPLQLFNIRHQLDLDAFTHHKIKHYHQQDVKPLAH